MQSRIETHLQYLIEFGWRIVDIGNFDEKSRIDSSVSILNMTRIDTRIGRRQMMQCE